ncbi:hypothetical protein BGK67_01065 [Streptomyces subrutilus]|uniref:Uncharacterized protein n=2 Tax=Streptomyces subrutilus TaxID=36818 RepID=A0A1E5PKQ2_9ACTN|nr:hypothetical protein BGK67_01065 [Streptomyces subrutilus]
MGLYQHIALAMSAHGILAGLATDEAAKGEAEDDPTRTAVTLTVEEIRRLLKHLLPHHRTH